MAATNANSRVNHNVVRFGPYDVDLASGELRKNGIRIGLRDQSFRVLATLLECPGEVITREDLRQVLWCNKAFGDFDNSLNAIIAHLREALCDSPEHPRFIETLPKRGYRFIADVSPILSSSAEAMPARSRLVVMPFLNLTGDPAQDYFSDAITDEIITALASIAPEGLSIIARTTAMRYKSTRKDLARIARELNVDYLVEGSVRRAGDRVSINVQLIQPSDQAHLFASRYEAELRDIFHLQSSIAEDIATHTGTPGVGISRGEYLSWEHTRKKPTQNLSAYNEYIQGRYLQERLTSEAMTAALQHFEHAIELDPDFALAHVALADFYSWLGYLGYMRPKDAYSIGVTYSLRAAQINDDLAEAHAVRAEYHKQIDFNWPAAEREMARALELSRGSPFVRVRNAVMVLMPENRIDEAVAEIERALELDPLAAGTRFWLGIMLLLARQYDRAIDEARVLLELEPNSPWPPYITGVAYRQKYYEALASGKTPESSSAAEFAEKAIAGHMRAIELSPASDVLLGWLGLCLGVCGRRTEALAVLDQLRRSERYILPTSFGHIHLGLGEFDAAFEWFDRAVEERDQIMMPILSYAHFDPLRADPRFTVLLRKMKLKAEPREREEW